MSLLDRFLPTKTAVMDPAVKVASGPGVLAMSYDPPLSMLLGQSPQRKMAAYLRAYKVGWFYKAESAISFDLATLPWHLEQDENEIPMPDLDIPFETLPPIGQLQRLLERPNAMQSRRQLWEKTMIRLDMAGNAFWYLDGASGVTLPTAIWGISPSRMWPSFDNGGNLIGWVMDYQDSRGSSSGKGVPFETSEIIHFAYGSADDELWGQGVVEAVFAETTISDLLARHTGDVLSTGGRLAGMIWPKGRSLDEDEFQDAQRAWRNTVDDPNAARRMLIFPEPMEWQNGSATPSEIGLPELQAINRLNILTAFPINEARLGVPLAAGLNSGGTRHELRQDYWEGTIHPRVEVFEETIQTELVALYEKATGTTLDFEMEEPNLDDASSLVTKAGAYQALVDLGFDEEGARTAAGLDHIPFAVISTPAPLIPPVAQPPALVSTVRPQIAERQTGSATVETIKAMKSSRRQETLLRVRESTDHRMKLFLAAQRDRVSHAVMTTLPRSKAARMKQDEGDWWDSGYEDGELTAVLRGIYIETAAGAMSVVADRMNRIVTPQQQYSAVDRILARGLQRISDMNENTRKAIAAQIAEGTRRGYSITQIVDGFPAENYPGIAAAGMDNGVAIWDDYRAEMIARTETALAYNEAAVIGYSDFGVQYLEAIDGDQDDECIARLAANPWSVDDAMGEDDHPNGTLDWVPADVAEEQKSTAMTLEYDEQGRLVRIA